MPVTRARDAGFTLLEVAISIAIIMIGAAIAVPIMSSALKGVGLRTSTRQVEAELQKGRLLAVTTNRAFRVRFNCPAANQYRVVELIGTPGAPDAADSSVDRCDPARYPFPAPDNDPLTLPNKDGALRTLMKGVSFRTAQDVEFWADGTVHWNPGGAVTWPLIPASGVSIAMTNGRSNSTITVNRFGKIQVK